MEARINKTILLGLRMLVIITVFSSLIFIIFSSKADLLVKLIALPFYISCGLFIFWSFQRARLQSTDTANYGKNVYILTGILTLILGIVGLVFGTWILTISSNWLMVLNGFVISLLFLFVTYLAIRRISQHA